MKKVTILGLFIAGSALAQSRLPLTVDKAVELGIENSKTLHSSLMKVEYADAKAGEINASRLPSLKFSGGYTRLSDIPPGAAVIPANAFGAGFTSATRARSYRARRFSPVFFSSPATARAISG